MKIKTKTARGSVVAMLPILLGSIAMSGPAQADPIDLADIVGGGNGTGNGTLGSGYRASDGVAVTGCTYAPTHFGNGDFNNVSASPYIDGVFRPDGGETVTVDSTGTAVSGVSDSSDLVWDHMLNEVIGAPNGCSNSPRPDYYATRAGETTSIRAHSNSGITFDIDAIELEHSGEATLFSAIAALANLSSAGVDYYVFVDGISAASGSLFGNDLTQNIGFSLAPDARFLTLIFTDRGNYSFDQTFWGDPTIKLQPTNVPVPEPGTLALLGLGLAGIGASRRRKKV